MQRTSHLIIVSGALLSLALACSGSDVDTGDQLDEGEQDVATCTAQVFEHCNYRGRAVCLRSGNYDRAELSERGMPNRSISSVKVSKGARVQLYSQNYQEGARLTLTANDSCLVNDGFNDRTASLRVTAPRTQDPVGSGGSPSTNTGGTGATSSGGTGGASSGGDGGTGATSSGGTGGTGATSSGGTGGASSGGTGGTGAASSGGTGAASSGGTGATSSGGTGGSGEAGSAGSGGSASSWWKPTPGVRWQWNISGTVDTSKDVPVFNIDLFDAPKSVIDELHAKGRRVICYFSAGSSEDWRPDFSQFTSSDQGAPLDGWEGERWLNTRSTNVRNIMKKRFDLAKSKGCDALEPDNVDGYQNDNGIGLTERDAIDYIRFMATEAHARGLSIGLKNALDIVSDLVNDVDWALNEQCSEYDECQMLLPFIEKNKAVFHCEYSSSAFNKACSDPRFDRFSSILKSLALTANPLTFCP